MQILINTVFTFVLMFWPIAMMMSPMMLDAPGSENDKGQLIIMMLFLCYPIGLFILLWLFGGSFFGVGGLKLAVVASVVIAIAFSVFGYFGMLANLHRGITNSGYSVADNKAYFRGKLIEGADAQSFNMLAENDGHYAGFNYATDKHFLYCDGKIVEGAIPDGIKKKFINTDAYLTNKTQVIYGDKILAGAHPGNFGGFDGFAAWTHSVNNDQYIVFNYGVPLPAVDKFTFTPLNDYIAKDKLHIFKNHIPILPAADAVSFVLLDNGDFAKDKHHIYYLATKSPFAVKDADPGSFKILERSYLKDKNNVYLVHQYESIEKLEHVIVGSFEATLYDDATNSEARDAKHYYYQGKVVGDR
ncbi:MAG: DKNYY domain-containing protein [Gallionellaceae bacterium]